MKTRLVYLLHSVLFFGLFAEFTLATSNVEGLLPYRPTGNETFETEENTALYSVEIAVEGDQSVADISRYLSDNFPLVLYSIDESQQSIEVVLSSGNLESLAKAGFHIQSVNQVTGEDGLQKASSVIEQDSDSDGLTDTEERWWGTNPEVKDTDGDGVSDGDEIAQLRAGDKSAGIPWPDWPKWGELPNANIGWGWGDDSEQPIVDIDRDCIPDAAERFVLGFNALNESTDNDRYDDGQEFFGFTEVGRGSLPRAIDSDFLLGEMPNFVDLPGRSPLVTAYPDIKVKIPNDRIKVTTLQVITTETKTINEQENIYETNTLERNTVNVVHERDSGMEGAMAQFGTVLQEISNTMVRIAETLEQQSVSPSNPENSGNGFSNMDASSSYTPLCNEALYAEVVRDIDNLENKQDELIQELAFNRAQLAIKERQIAATDAFSDTIGAKAGIGGIGFNLNLSGLVTGTVNAFNQNAAAEYESNALIYETGLDAVEMRLQSKYQILGQFATCRMPSESSIDANRAPLVSTFENLQKMSSGLPLKSHESEKITEVRTRNYNRMLSRNEWSQATTTDTGHAADLSFEIGIANLGTDVAREITSIWVNVSIGSSGEIAHSMDLLAEGNNSSSITNLFPGSSFSINAPVDIELSLDELKAIDSGEPIRIAVERIEYGSDQLFYENAFTGGIHLMVDDGVEDLENETLSFLIPTWGTESYLQAVSRAKDVLPIRQQSDGRILSVTVPTYDSRGRLVDRSELFNTDISRWVFFTQSNDAFINAIAQPESTVLFRYVKDSDQDGYDNHTEFAIGTDFLDAEDFPAPELNIGFVDETGEDNVRYRTLVIKNTGNYPATGVDARMYSPGGMTNVVIGNLGISGYIPAGQTVVIGPEFTGMSLDSWSGTASPYLGGTFSGTEVVEFTFSMLNDGYVGQAGTDTRVHVSWGIDQSVELQLGDGYAAPSYLPIGDTELEIAFSSGYVREGDVFKVRADPHAQSLSYILEEGSEADLDLAVSYNTPRGGVVKHVQKVLNDRSEVPNTQEESPGIIMTVASLSKVSNGQPVDINFTFNCPVAMENSRIRIELFDPESTDGKALYTSDENLTLQKGHNNWNYQISPTNVISSPLSINTRYIVLATWVDGYGEMESAYPIVTGATTFELINGLENETSVLEIIGGNLDFGELLQGKVGEGSFILFNPGFESVEILLPVELPGIELSLKGNKLVLMPGEAVEVHLNLDTFFIAQGLQEFELNILTSDGSFEEVINLQCNILENTSSVQVDAIANHPWDWSLTIQGPKNEGQVIALELPESFNTAEFFPVEVLDEQGYRILSGPYTDSTSAQYGVWQDRWNHAALGLTLPFDIEAGTKRTLMLKMGKLTYLDEGNATLLLEIPNDLSNEVSLDAFPVMDHLAVFPFDLYTNGDTSTGLYSAEASVKILNSVVSMNTKLTSKYGGHNPSAKSVISRDLSNLLFDLHSISFVYDFTSHEAQGKSFLSVFGNDIELDEGSDVNVLISVDGDNIVVDVDGVLSSFTEINDYGFSISLESNNELGITVNDSSNNGSPLVVRSLKVNDVSVFDLYDDELYVFMSGNSYQDSGSDGINEEQFKLNEKTNETTISLYGYRDGYYAGWAESKLEVGFYSDGITDLAFFNAHDLLDSSIYTKDRYDPTRTVFSTNPLALDSRNLVFGVKTKHEISNDERYDYDLSYNRIEKSAVNRVVGAKIDGSNSNYTITVDSIKNANSQELFEKLVISSNNLLTLASATSAPIPVAVTGLIVKPEVSYDLTVESIVGLENLVSRGESVTTTVTLDDIGSTTYGEFLAQIYLNINEQEYLVGAECFNIPETHSGDYPFDVDVIVPNFSGSFPLTTRIFRITSGVKNLIAERTFTEIPVSIAFTSGTEFDSGGLLEGQQVSSSNGDGGYIDGFSHSWGSTPLETVRLGYTGEVNYSFSSLDPESIYNLTTSFYQPDGLPVQMQLYCDGVLLKPFTVDPDSGFAEEGFAVDLNQNEQPSTVFASAYLPQETLKDGEVQISIRSAGNYPATVSTIAVKKGNRLFINAGSDDDFVYGSIDPTSGITYGYSDAKPSYPFQSSERSVRISPVGEVAYQFSGLESEAHYVIRAKYYDAGQRYLRLAIDGVLFGDVISLNDQEKTKVTMLPDLLIGSDREFTLSVVNVDPTGSQMLPGSSSIQELELLEFTGQSILNQDTDNDGIPDLWEVNQIDPARVIRMNAAVVDSDQDYDNDSISNYQEYVMGTDPFVMDSTQLSIVTHGNLIAVSWPSQAGRLYILQSSVDLENWEPVGSGLVGSEDQPLEKSIAVADYKDRFFRVVVQRLY